MATKQLIYQEDARKALERGINKVADAVKTTCMCNKGYIQVDLESITHDYKTRCLCDS